MEETLYKYMDWPGIEGIIYRDEHTPRDVMAPKVTEDGILIQCYYPDAVKIQVRTASRKTCEMVKVDESGYFAALLPGKQIPRYSFSVTLDEEGKVQETLAGDPYRFPCQLTEKDEKRFLAGIHYEIYEKLGAHPMELNGIAGTAFAVWAPNAVSVSVIGEFNHWDGRRYPMQRMPESGIYELFVPGVTPGALYKYEMKLKNGETIQKGDPYAMQAELPPAAASIVASAETYPWKDEKWQNAARDSHREALHIMELDLLEWKKNRETDDPKKLADELAAYLKKAGYTHLQLLPPMEYLDERSKGYATAWYYAPTGRFGTADELKYLIDVLHRNEIGVIFDWQAAHFPNFAEGLCTFDGTCLYENADERKKYHPFFGTLFFNYGSPLVQNFLIANAFYWMRVFHIDGLRLDDVDAMLYLDYGRGDGEWAPNMYGTNENLEALEFLKHLHSVVRKEHPGFLFIAQEDGLWPGLTEPVEDDCLGFDYKWNRGFTQDLLEYFRKSYQDRRAYHDQLTFSMVYAYSEHYILTLGSRDIGDFPQWMEQFPGTDEEKAANLRAALGYLMCHPGKKMTVQPQGLSEELQTYLRELSVFYKEHPALYEKDEEQDGFEWLQLMKYEENVVAFLRKGTKEEDTLLVLCNFSPKLYENYSVGVPYSGKYKEIFNSDKKEFGGSGSVNPRVKMSKKKECDEREDSIAVKLAPLCISIFSYSKVVEALADNQEAKKKKSTAKKKNLKEELQNKMEQREDA